MVAVVGWLCIVVVVVVVVVVAVVVVVGAAVAVSVEQVGQMVSGLTRTRAQPANAFCV